jgi:hypothetical protein
LQPLKGLRVDPGRQLLPNILVNFIEKLRVHDTDIKQQANEDHPGHRVLIAKKEKWINARSEKVKSIIAARERDFIRTRRTVLSDDEKESLAELKRNTRDENRLKFIIDHH